jgi:uncharacterized protein (TIGR02246 family)
MPSQAADKESTETIASALVRHWALAWNQHDMDFASTLVAPGIDFVTVTGKWLRGRSEFLAHHRALHAVQMRESIWTNLGFESKTLSDRLHVLQLEWGIQGDFDPDGTPRGPRRGHFTWIIAIDNGAQILVAQNTNLGRGIDHRLAQDAKKEAPWVER